MDKIKSLEDALKRHSQVCNEQNVPVGIVVSDSGKIMVRYSLSQTPKMFTGIADAAEYIIDFKNTQHGRTF